MDRRSFLRTAGAAGATLLAPGSAAARQATETSPDSVGVLVDTTLCIGCRKCEWACNGANDLPEASIEDFEDKSVFAAMRRPDGSRFTVVNRWGTDKSPIWAKVQCMHCQDPACSSACIVTAFSRREDGAVVYDVSRCLGCRYCMVACPFQVPAYEWLDPLTPRVRKCTFCAERIAEGEKPACVSVCPVECLTYGRREELVELAHGRIEAHPSRYVDHVYGEHEVGGTSWLYLAGVPFADLGFPELGSAPVPNVTETIQHSIFKNFFPPLALYAFLGQIMWLTGKGRGPRPAVEPGGEVPLVAKGSNGRDGEDKS
jgi:Fe-S-cluster-containing dehydrogenase component